MHRRLLALSSLAGLILSLSGVSTANAFLPLHASRTTPSALNLTLGDISKPQSEFLQVPSLPARRETNAKRLARGLSPNRPRTYYNAERNARDLRARQSPTPCPIPRRQGVISIVFPRGDSDPGFLGKDDYLGMYQFTTELEDALQISLGGCEEDISAGSIFHIETTVRRLVPPLSVVSCVLSPLFHVCHSFRVPERPRELPVPRSIKKSSCNERRHDRWVLQQRSHRRNYRMYVLR